TMRRARSAARGKALSAWGLGVSLAGLVGCGRIGFDALAEQDASMIGSQPEAGMQMPPPDAGDATLDDGGAPDAGDDGAAICMPGCVNAHGGTSCENGTCVPVCDTGYADCNGDVSDGCETNVQADPANCGACTKVCAVDAGSAVCQSSMCAMSSCPPGTGDCDMDAGDGCETDLNTSTANCRFCGNACT